MTKNLDDPFEMTDIEPSCEHDDGGISIGRRKILAACLGVSAGILGAAKIRSQLLHSDTGGYKAPENYPVISTRSHFHTPLLGGIERATGVSKTDYELYGDWSNIRGGDDPEITVFVHGLNVSADTREDINQAYATQTALEDNGYDGHVVAFSWDSDKGVWWRSKEIAARVGPKLAHWTQAYLQQTKGTVRYVAHSLGARVVLQALSFLDQQATTGHRSTLPRVASVSVLGGAVPSVTPSREKRPIERACKRFDNFYKRDDRTLQALSLIEVDEMLGQSGFPTGRTAPSNYSDSDVTKRVTSHDTYFQPGEGCIPRVVESF